MAAPDRDTTHDENSDAKGASPRVTVLAPAPLMVVEIVNEPSADDDDGHIAIHMHAGGQGAWVAGMAASLGAEVSLCAPLGGEMGAPLRKLLAEDGITVTEVINGAGTGASVVDLRGDDRVTLADMPSPPLGRHELDDLYGLALVDALESDVLIVTGVDPPELVPASFFGRLVADVRAGGVPVVADLSGDAALAAIDEGPSVLKMSHEEILALGLADDDSLESLMTTGEQLVANGTDAVVISRADKPALLVTANGARLFTTPAVTTVMHRGAGDSMTAGIAVAIGRGMDIDAALRLGAAAGALNVARRGLGSGRRDQIERFAEQIEITDAADGDPDGSA
jgi:1-phosphofructokinase